VRVGGVLFIALGLFVLVAGTVYGIWGTELAGTVYLCVLGVAFVYLARVLLHAARSEPAATEDPTAAIGPDYEADASLSREALEPVPVVAHASPPAITPFLFALAGALVVLGLVFTKWLVLVGALGLGLVAIAWFLETGPRRHGAGHGGGEHQDGGEHEAASPADTGAQAPADH
jgi:Cytochrome c oxidase subunit IV